MRVTSAYVRPAAAAVLGAFATVALVGVSTDVVPNPWFDRKVPVDAFDVAVLVVLSLLMGALAASYALSGETAAGARRAGVGSGLLGWLAVSCPLCNKIVVALLAASAGTGLSSAVQPALGVAAIVLSAGALVVRVRSIMRAACPLPARPANRSAVSTATRVGREDAADG